jgi:hypothetical protein
MNNSNIESDKIDRILDLVDKEQKSEWVETLSTILLSLATLLSAWCVFQASQWNGEQYFRINDENLANQLRVQSAMTVNLRKSTETQFLLLYLSASSSGNTKYADFLRQRFPSHLEKAMLAWLALDPFNNNSAPKSPMFMKEYIIPESSDVEKYSKQVLDFKNLANDADKNSDNYMLMSLILSMTLFFCGLSGVANSHLSQRILISIATLALILSIVILFRMPVIV